MTLIKAQIHLPCTKLAKNVIKNGRRMAVGSKFLIFTTLNAPTNYGT